MILKDRVATLYPTHILVKLGEHPVGGFSITYPEDSLVDEIDSEWISTEDAGWDPEIEGEKIWVICFYMMGSLSDSVYMRTDHIELPDMMPYNDEFDEIEDEEVVTFSDITEAEYENLYAILGLPVMSIDISEFGTIEACYPEEYLRTPEQTEVIENRLKMTYEELLGIPKP